MGAEVLEFHFTDSREGKSFRDHKVSLTPDEVKALIEEIKLIQEFKGNAKKAPTQIELDNGHELSFRRAVYPKRDIAKGEVLTEENLCVLRPNHGIDARDFDKLLGSSLNQNVKAQQRLDWEMLNR
jgi:N,N'-diacetyllegionaminate synthase